MTWEISLVSGGSSVLFWDSSATVDIHFPKLIASSILDFILANDEPVPFWPTTCT